MSILEVKNLSKSFGKVKVLKGIDFSVEKGEIISVIGSSGNGKTTLLRCLNFLEIPEEGIIKVDGETIFDAAQKRRLTEREIRKSRLKFGLVFQNFNLFPQYTALQNVALAMKLLSKDGLKNFDGNIDEIAAGYLKRVGLEDKLSSYPCELSGGQQQRVAIARALALNPEILFFDEPTSALDPELTVEVLSTLKELAKERITMIIVTHEMGFAKSISDRVVFMANGKIEEQGPPREIFENPKSSLLRAFLSHSEKMG